MTDQPYTPTIGFIKSRYEAGRLALDGADTARLTVAERSAEFDRWHAAEIAAAEQRGAERALREARSDWFQYADAINDTPSKYYPALWLKNRADRLEADND